MADIVLRDRNGKEIDYPGIDYLNVKTPDGETKGYAAYDPETLVPENLASGVVVGDVEGVMSVPQAVKTTIDPDFSAGDMEVVPEAGQVFSTVDILKPANLTPGNIAEGVEIAGIIGTLAAGGGSAVEPYIEYTVNENGEPVTAKMYGFTTIPAALFYYHSSLQSVDLTASPNLTSIGKEAFKNCTSLTSITIPDSVTNIGEHAFTGCTKLASITIPDSVTNISNHAFYNCTALASVTIGNSVTNIGNYAFYSCSLTSITIPDSVTSIGHSAFRYCTHLDTVVIGEKVISISAYAFADCTALTSAIFKVTTGWWYSSSSSATSGTSVTVTDTAKVATYLRSTYKTYYWGRS